MELWEHYRKRHSFQARNRGREARTMWNVIAHCHTMLSQPLAMTVSIPSLGRMGSNSTWHRTLPVAHDQQYYWSRFNIFGLVLWATFFNSQTICYFLSLNMAENLLLSQKEDIFTDTANNTDFLLQSIGKCEDIFFTQFLYSH